MVTYVCHYFLELRRFLHILDCYFRMNNLRKSATLSFASPKSGGLEELAWGPVREPLLLCMLFSLLFSYLWDVWWRIRQVFPHDKREDPSSKCKTLNRPESVGQHVMSPNSSFKYNEFVSTWEIQFSSFAVFSVEDFTCNTAARWVTTVKYDLNFFFKIT